MNHAAYYRITPINTLERVETATILFLKHCYFEDISGGEWVHHIVNSILYLNVKIYWTELIIPRERYPVVAQAVSR